MPTRAVLLVKMSNQLDAVEAEMKRIGYWSDVPPDLQADYASGKRRTYLDAPSFELWLQQIFLPNAREGVRTQSLPSGSSVGVMAMRQYDYHSSVPEAHGLMQLLQEFDRLVEDAAAASRAGGAISGEGETPCRSR